MNFSRCHPWFVLLCWGQDKDETKPRRKTQPLGVIRQVTHDRLIGFDPWWEPKLCGVVKHQAALSGLTLIWLVMVGGFMLWQSSIAVPQCNMDKHGPCVDMITYSTCSSHGFPMFSMARFDCQRVKSWCSSGLTIFDILESPPSMTASSREYHSVMANAQRTSAHINQKVSWRTCVPGGCWSINQKKNSFVTTIYPNRYTNLMSWLRT